VHDSSLKSLVKTLVIPQEM